MTQDTFEKSIKELEQIVTALEQGNLSLDAALKQFENGIGLTRQCQSILDQAELKVTTLLNTTPCKPLT